MGKMDSFNIVENARVIRDYLKGTIDKDENRIDETFQLVKPFLGTGEIKLIIIGQDPTVKRKSSRVNIRVTLNLDKSGALKNYIEIISKQLGLSLENIYATNLFKYFYTDPPANTLNVLKDHIEPNLELLKKEISQYPDALVITLGQPLLKLLVANGGIELVRYYWDYNIKTKDTNRNFQFCGAGQNKISRHLFPFPHQPSLRKPFYNKTLGLYLSFLKEHVT